MVAQKEIEKLDKNTIAYLLGILSIVFAFIEPLAGVVFGIVGLIQSKNSAKKIRRLSIIGLVLSIILFVVTMIVIYYWGNQFTSLFPSS